MLNGTISLEFLDSDCLGYRPAQTSELFEQFAHKQFGNGRINYRSKVLRNPEPYTTHRLLLIVYRLPLPPPPIHLASPRLRRYYLGLMNELVFEITQEEDGGFCAECLSENIFTQGDSWDEVRRNVKEAVHAFYFDKGQAPSRIRLHLVRDELLSGA